MNCMNATAKLMLAAVLLVPVLARAQDVPAAVTVYNQNRALITEVRKVAIPKGVQTVEFKDVAETVEPASLQIRSLTSPKALKILEQHYEYDLINVPNLLNKYIGKQLKIIIPDPGGPKGAMIIRDAKLLANNDKPIFQLSPKGEGSSLIRGNEIYVGSYDAILLPEIPQGLRPWPTLICLVDNQGSPEQEIQVSYLAHNMNWKADYVLKVNREDTEGSLSGWVTLENRCGKTFKAAKVKLVAGDIHLVQRGRPETVYRALGSLAKAAETMPQEEFFEYHLYTLGRPVDVANRQTKQLSLLQAPNVKMEKHLVGSWNNQINGVVDGSVQKEKLGVLLKFANKEQNGLGIPLPKGIVRIYQESGDGTTIFIGEDVIDHTGKNADVELKTGESFDVFVERKQVEYQKIGTNGVRYSWELRVKNGKDVPQKVELEETMPGEWSILNSSTQYEKLDAHRIKFTVEAQPSSQAREAVVSYEAEVHW